VEENFTRRELLAKTPAAVGTGLAAGMLEGQEFTLLVETRDQPAEPFGYCLNTSTLMGQKLDLVEIVEIAAKAGYQAIEPWMNELDQHVKNGGNLKVLGQRIRDRGLTVESAIGFAEWIVNDEAKRKKGLEEVRRGMDMIQQIGGKRLAAPPAGATNLAHLDLFKAAERYRALLDLGEQMGVIPQVELWGFSKCLSRLGEVVFVALESGHPQACILLDVYHLYKGGSNFGGLRLLNGAGLQVLHFNDYPAQPPRTAITDAQRVYPGDGVAPLKTILRDLRQIGFRGVLSLELFNRDYWKQDALAVARTGLEKMRAVVRSAFS
jgi:sugar phosphate isomerase/epimerase